MSTIACATVDTALAPAHIAIPPKPKVPTIYVPSVRTANPNPVIVRPTEATQPRPGYLLYLPLAIILSVSTIAIAITGIKSAPATIASAPTPVNAIAPSSKIANPNPIIVRPTDATQPRPGYLPYSPADNICEDTITAIAIIGIIKAPKTIPAAPTPLAAAIPTNNTDGIIAKTINPKPIPKSVNFNRNGNSISALSDNI